MRYATIMHLIITHIKANSR